MDSMFFENKSRYDFDGTVSRISETYVSRMNSAMFAPQIGGVMQEVMTGAFEEMEGFISQIVAND